MSNSSQLQIERREARMKASHPIEPIHSHIKFFTSFENEKDKDNGIKWAI